MERSSMSSNYYFKRQFLFCSNTIDNERKIFNHRAFKGFNIYTHPDLDVNTAHDDKSGVAVAAVGFILNPANPDQSGLEVLENFARDVRSVADAAGFLHGLTGRYALFALIRGQYYIFHDPCGLRSVFYKEDESGFFAGSSTEILKLATSLAQGEKYATYFSSKYVRDDIEHWIPSGCSLYDDVSHLVPNHYLAIGGTGQVRYWPTQPLAPLNVEAAAESAAKTFESSLAAAARRFPLAVPMTAGWDSRLILASSKRIAARIFFYTLQYRSLTRNSDDITIPRKLLRRLGYKHHVLDCRIDAAPDFMQAYEQNTLPSHFNDWGKIAYGLLKSYPQDHVCLKGNCSEIARCFYYPKGTHETINHYSQLVALERGWHELPFINRRIEQWMQSAAPLAQSCNIDILDLFYWEHRMGSWQAQSQLEWDVAQEAFTPFNNRALLQSMLATPAAMRSAPAYELYQKIIDRNWPKVMLFPINPPEAEPWLKAVLNKLGLVAPIKRILGR
jgi:hypothetical protein